MNITSIYKTRILALRRAIDARANKLARIPTKPQRMGDLDLADSNQVKPPLPPQANPNTSAIVRALVAGLPLTQGQMNTLKGI
jgi:hypothetical protein